jgi:hypothetical protein
LITHYLAAFGEIIQAPFEHTALIWGIVPLYFALLLNELTSGKASFRTAVQTGFSFIWAGIQWLYPYFKPHSSGGPRIEFNAMTPVNLFITSLVLALGALALFSGLRRKYPKYCSFLGYTRFSNYFMITIYPMQARALDWTWDRVLVIGIFALPIWLILHFGLMPIRPVRK